MAAFVIAFIVLICNVSLVQCTDECKTHADCKNKYFSYKFCCYGEYFGDYVDKDRSCTQESCLNHYCSTDSDCGDLSMCCRSKKCVNKGCSGCATNTDCYSTYVCCKNTLPLNQTVCAADCIKQTCNWNDDCGGSGECCRSGTCVKTGCGSECESNSECNLGQYCCKKKTSSGGSCSESCVGAICSIDEDCGGARDVCCISNKCVDRGCSRCSTNSNCSSGQYCCKKREWYELSECSADCIGKSCNADKDCGGPSETCGDDNRCITGVSPPLWMIAVTTVSIVLFLVAVGISLALFWYMKRKPPANGAVPLLESERSGFQNQRQGNTQLSDVNTAQHQGITFSNQPYPNSNVSSVAPQSHNPGFLNATHGNPIHVQQNPTRPTQGNENQGFYRNKAQENQTAPTPSNNAVHLYQNPPHNPFYSICESSNVPQSAQYPDGCNDQQMYPPSAPYQDHPYNPYQGNQ